MRISCGIIAGTPPPAPASTSGASLLPTNDALDEKYDAEGRQHEQEQPGEEIQPTGIDIEITLAVTTDLAARHRQRIRGREHKVDIGPRTFIKSVDASHNLVRPFKAHGEGREMNRTVWIGVAVAVSPLRRGVPAVESLPANDR
jgi:hypothetical protein